MRSTKSCRSWVAGIFFLATAQALAATAGDYYQAALRYYNQKQYDSAVRYFQAALQMDPKDWQAYQGLSYSYYAQGDRSKALSEADKGLELNPNNPSLKQFADSLRGSAPSLPAPSSSFPKNVSPVIGGGNFGIGLDLGGPGTWGATGKYWMDDKNAFQGAVKLDGGGTILQLDYLWHDYDFIHVSHGAMPFYIGLGGDLAVGGNSVVIAARVPVGLTYLFQKKDVPIDIFIEVAPTVWIGTGGADFEIYGDLGSRYYF